MKKSKKIAVSVAVLFSALMLSRALQSIDYANFLISCCALYVFYFFIIREEDNKEDK